MFSFLRYKFEAFGKLSELSLMSFLICSYSVEPCGFSTTQCCRRKIESVYVSELNCGDESGLLPWRLTARAGVEEVV